jgi:hypothetical protein
VSEGGGAAAPAERHQSFQSRSSRRVQSDRTDSTALLLVPKMTQHPEFLVLAWVVAVATGLSPDWFFLGTERMPMMAGIQLAFRVIGAGLTFLFVRGPATRGL